MDVTIKVTGMVQVLGAVRAIGEAGRAVNGPLASVGSALIYAPIIETGMRGGRMWRRAGPALMFKQGLDETLPQVPAILGPAIPKGAGSVGQAKRKIRDLWVARTRAHTPVRSGKLRASVREMTRPGP